MDKEVVVHIPNEILLSYKKEQMDKEVWYIYPMKYYSAIKKNTFESILMRWVKLEHIIQSDVNQKEKNQYSILMLIHGS